ncbi:hypothetical protein NDU88_007681 [Pleurodeles waltl]|uniref:Uncharacterized protein n=1 Tax=Pleurodeles waltl TaxID=8319 RepID=A0AAV7NTS5_PLEWA|nr:hypothetical protein NDU88_007681 [Pleurodeles waltl]
MGVGRGVKGLGVDWGGGSVDLRAGNKDSKARRLVICLNHDGSISEDGDDEISLESRGAGDREFATVRDISRLEGVEVSSEEGVPFSRASSEEDEISLFRAFMSSKIGVHEKQLRILPGKFAFEVFQRTGGEVIRGGNGEGVGPMGFEEGGNGRGVVSCGGRHQEDEDNRRATPG